MFKIRLAKKHIVLFARTLRKHKFFPFSPEKVARLILQQKKELALHGYENMCENQKCEYKPTLKAEVIKRTLEEIKYGQLWAEIELPKLLKEVKE